MSSPEQPGAPSATVDLALASSGLTKRFRGGQLAVDGIDLAVPTGSVYGFLGPNGSGKTTTIRMLLGLIQPTQGSHAVLGLPMPDAQAELRCRWSGRWSRDRRSTRICPAGPTWPGSTLPTEPRGGRPRRSGSTGRWTGSACSRPRTSAIRPTRSA